MISTGVSFAIPVYNKAPWLPWVLNAIKAQTGDFEREYVFVDDGSTDGSMNIVREKTQSWDNVKIFEQDNHGSAHATNRCIELCTQPYVKFVDADDLLASHATETLLNVLDGSDAVLAYGDVTRYDHLEDIDLNTQVSGPAVMRIDQPLIPALRNSMFNPTQFLARRESLMESGMCDERVVHSQEYSLTLRLARLGPFLKVAAPVAFLPKHVPGSLGTNQGRQLRRVTLAVANFLGDYSDLPTDVKAFACKRVAGRALRFRCRNHGAGFLSSWFWMNIRARLSLITDHAAFAKRCVAAFED
jgi:glycosyltransferase involved in cell wall biosynthesis